MTDMRVRLVFTSVLSQEISESLFHSVMLYLKAMPEYVILSGAKDLPSFGPHTSLSPSLPSTGSKMLLTLPSYFFAIL
jgi:hypothetical protein